MICFNDTDDRQWDYHPRARYRNSGRSPERFRMARVKTGRSTNQVRRGKGQPKVGGLCRRRIKRVR